MLRQVKVLLAIFPPCWIGYFGRQNNRLKVIKLRSTMFILSHQIYKVNTFLCDSRQKLLTF